MPRIYILYDDVVIISIRCIICTIYDTPIIGSSIIAVCLSKKDANLSASLRSANQYDMWIVTIKRYYLATVLDIILLLASFSS